MDAAANDERQAQIRVVSDELDRTLRAANAPPAVALAAIARLLAGYTLALAMAPSVRAGQVPAKEPTMELAEALVADAVDIVNIYFDQAARSLRQTDA